MHEHYDPDFGFPVKPPEKKDWLTKAIEILQGVLLGALWLLVFLLLLWGILVVYNKIGGLL